MMRLTWLKDRLSEWEATPNRDDIVGSFQYNSLREIVIKELKRRIEQEEANPTTGDILWAVSGIGYKTQKARGLAAIGRHVEISSYGLGVRTNPSILVLPYDVIPPDYLNNLPHGLFARPAPMRPRHGFVESQRVYGWHLLAHIFQQTLIADPNGEVILMRPRMGAFSAVAANAGVTWGMLNNGATDGKNGSAKHIPSINPTWKGNILYEPNRIGVENTPYLELVQDISVRAGFVEYSDLVQVRDGPEQPTTKDFIPKRITVKNVYYPTGDLLSWEKKVKEMNPATDVVAAKSLSSHWAVHAIENGISVVTSRWNVYAGEELVPVKNKPKFSTKSYKKLRDYLKYWKGLDYMNGWDHASVGHSIYPIIGTVHAMGQWDDSDHLLRLRAFAVDGLLRVLNAAIAGELRHYNCNTNRPDPTKYGLPKLGSRRDVIYYGYLRPKTYAQMAKFLRSGVITFGKEGCWRDGFGGHAWKNVASAARKLALRLQIFMRKPSETTWKEVAMAANVALHMAHNNGPTVSKWVDRNALNLIAENPAFGFLSPVAGRVVLGLPMFVSPISTRNFHTELKYDEPRCERCREIEEERVVITASDLKLLVSTEEKAA